MKIQYDYTHQAWVADGKYVRCGHPEQMNCGCYGKENVGKPVDPKADMN